MNTGARGNKTKRDAVFSPLSPMEEAKKARTRGSSDTSCEMEENGTRQRLFSSGPIMDVTSIHEVILTRVNDALSIFKPADGAEVDPVMKAVPVIATAVSVAVGEVMREIMKRMDEMTRPLASPREERLLAAVRTLTYENDRLQQYSRRESVRIVGIPSCPGETAEQVEEKAIKVLNDAGAKVKREDIAVTHRAGKEKKGSRPIIVKFVSRRTRNEVTNKKKQLKEKEGYKRVFILDDITPLRARLLAYIKNLECVERAWTVDGRIFCAKKSPPGLAPDDRPKPVIIKTPDDLFKLGLVRVDYAAFGLSHLAEDDALL